MLQSNSDRARYDEQFHRDLLKRVTKIGSGRQQEVGTTNHQSDVDTEFAKYIKDIYFDATNTIRHYDTQRASFTSIFATLLSIFGAVLLAAITHSMSAMLITLASAVMTLLAVVSCLVILKYDSLIALQRRRASNAMVQYEKFTSSTSRLSSINADARHSVASEIGSRLSLGKLWLAIFLILTASGGGITAWAVIRVFH